MNDTQILSQEQLVLLFNTRNLWHLLEQEMDEWMNSLLQEKINKHVNTPITEIKPITFNYTEEEQVTLNNFQKKIEEARFNYYKLKRELIKLDCADHPEKIRQLSEKRQQKTAEFQLFFDSLLVSNQPSESLVKTFTFKNVEDAEKYQKFQQELKEIGDEIKKLNEEYRNKNNELFSEIEETLDNMNTTPLNPIDTFLMDHMEDSLKIQVALGENNVVTEVKISTIFETQQQGINIYTEIFNALMHELSKFK